MKAILLLAFCALAAHASFNITQFNTALFGSLEYPNNEWYSPSLDFEGGKMQFVANESDISQIEAGTQCYKTLQTLLEDAEKILSTGDLSGIGSIISEVQSGLYEECESYVQTFIEYAYERTNATNIEELKRIIGLNLAKSYDYVISHLGYAMDSLVNDDDSQIFGEQIATIYRILLGIDTPFDFSHNRFEDVKAPNFTVPFDEDKFLAALANAFYVQHRLSNTDNFAGFVECVHDTQDMISEAFEILKELPSLDLSEDAYYFEGLVNLVKETVSECEVDPVLKENFIDPVVQAFEKDPLNFIIADVYSFAENLPLYRTLAKTAMYELFSKGDYEYAGEEASLLGFFVALMLPKGY